MDSGRIRGGRRQVAVAESAKLRNHGAAQAGQVDRRGLGAEPAVVFAERRVTDAEHSAFDGPVAAIQREQFRHIGFFSREPRDAKSS